MESNEKAAGGCAGAGRGSREVTAYVSADRPFSEPVMKEYERRAGVRVNVVYDTRRRIVGCYSGEGTARPLQPGMVLTIEPGLYVAPDAPGAPAELQGIGIRIEDDILVTETGFENLTRGTPKTVAEIEAVVTS